MVREAGQRKRVIEGKERETDRGRNGERSGPEEESYRGKDSKLNWGNHDYDVCKKVNQRLYFLRKLR